MRPGKVYLQYHFIVFGLFTLLAQSPAIVLYATILTVGVGGLLLLASPTILLYSVGLLPLWFAITNRPRRWSQIAATLLVPAAIAVLPAVSSKISAKNYGHNASRGDFTLPSFGTPTSIEIIGNDYDVFESGQEVGDKIAPCSEVCRRLLFGREVEQVRMTKVALPNRYTQPGPSKSVTYRLQKRDSCPQAYPDGIQIGKAFRERLVAGDCLIGEIENPDSEDVTVNFQTIYNWQLFPVPSNEAPAFSKIQEHKRLVIEQRKDTGSTVQIALRNETKAEIAALPFYLGYSLSLGGGGYSGQTIGHSIEYINPIDLVESLRSTFGFKIAPVEPPPPESIAQIADRILSLQAAPVLSAQQQESIDEFLLTMSKQPSLSANDVDFVRRVISDTRITEARLGSTLQIIFRKHHAQLEPLLSAIIDRLKLPVAEHVGHYLNGLGWIVASYSVDTLLPYRDRIISIVEAQSEWPSSALLSRVGELGNDTSDLIIKRLDAKSGTVSQSAAVAACRASDEIWVKLEPIVLARLEVLRNKHPDDKDSKLMLALIRHGKKHVVAEFVDGSDAHFKARMTPTLSKFDSGFDPSYCSTF